MYCLSPNLIDLIFSKCVPGQFNSLFAYWHDPKPSVPCLITEELSIISCTYENALPGEVRHVPAVSHSEAIYPLSEEMLYGLNVRLSGGGQFAHLDDPSTLQLIVSLVACDRIKRVTEPFSAHLSEQRRLAKPLSPD